MRHYFVGILLSNLGCLFYWLSLCYSLCSLKGWLQLILLAVSTEILFRLQKLANCNLYIKQRGIYTTCADWLAKRLTLISEWALNGLWSSIYREQLEKLPTTLIMYWVIFLIVLYRCWIIHKATRNFTHFCLGQWISEKNSAETWVLWANSLLKNWHRPASTPSISLYSSTPLTETQYSDFIFSVFKSCFS